jgi:hypothetical protein
VSELTSYVILGFRHITDPSGADHILFLLVLAAIYRLRDWRGVLWVVTAFTFGHSLTLALAVTGLLQLPTPIIEFLIPVTIVVTGVGNIVVRERSGSGTRMLYRSVFAATFGLVHGAGFANYLRSLFVERVAVPLLGFNIGIELGQIVVLAVALAGFLMLDRTLSLLRRADGAMSAPRLRAVLVSSCVAIVAAQWAVERAPW